MMKLHVILKKEEIREEEIDQQKIAIVYDVLFATTTITACLEAGALAVRPVLHEQEASAYYETICPEDYIIAGESEGAVIDGFLFPAPKALQQHVKGKRVILSTTNGTVAIRRVAQAKAVYAASIRNTSAVIDKVLAYYEGETIIIVCAGSMNQLNLEDFYAAGYFVSQFSERMPKMALSDSAIAAKYLYEGYCDESKQVLAASRVGAKMIEAGFVEELEFTSEQDCTSVVPRFVAGQLIE